MPLLLPANLAALARLTGDATRYAVNCLRVIDPGDTSYRVEATDGRRLAVVRGNCPRESCPALEEAPHSPGAVLVGPEEWGQAFKLAGKNRPVGLAAAPGVLTFAVGTRSFTAAPAEGRYPNVDQVLPKRPALVTFTVNPRLATSLFQLATALGLEQVNVLYYGHGLPVGLTGHNDEGQFVDCLLVPMS
jgi:hypothetical protein